MKKDDDKNLHEGHRKRLVDLAFNAGVDNMSDIQVMELFLTYIFPRGDVNPLAHRLLQSYDSLTHVVDADVADLMNVAGLNERSAKKIALFSELFYYYATSKMGRKFVVTCKADIIDLVEDNLRFRNTENMIIFAISPANIVTHKRRINLKSSSEVCFPVLDFTNFLSTSKPSSVVVAHCHPYGRATPSDADKKAFNLIKNVCTTCGVNLIDSYIVGEDGVYSQTDNVLSRTYYDVEELKTAIKNIVG